MNCKISLAGEFLIIFCILLFKYNCIVQDHVNSHNNAATPTHKFKSTILKAKNKIKENTGILRKIYGWIKIGFSFQFA